jgi:prepilin-type N-terminal cleavage/methylation domain-containing protein
MSTRTDGFTLLEVAIVLSVIAVLTAVALPVYSGIIDRAEVATMKSDLRNLATAQEAYFSDHQGYAPNVSSLGAELRVSDNVTVFVDSGTATGWGATAMHSGTGSSCRAAYGRAGQQEPTCSDDPVVRIVDPGAGAEIEGEEVRFALRTGGVRLGPGRVDGEGPAHHHLFIDRDVTPLSDPIPHGEADIIHLRPGQSELRLPWLAPGEHQVIALLSDGAHVPLLPPVTDTIRFAVKGR